MEGGASSGIRLARVTNSVHSYDVLTRKWTRVVVQGQGPGPHYGHVMDLVAQRYLVIVGEGLSPVQLCLGYIFSILWKILTGRTFLSVVRSLFSKLCV
ncbi:hypothetical protein L484_020801 [Morus notabilis]|uniref:Uncharacterized protein n=1 Tax=Morus notabilis TaxID=981085 RepID=W9RV14_9ROSA|nr:hypothetical protein L484_020801 [Morus notabilis]